VSTIIPPEPFRIIIKVDVYLSREVIERGRRFSDMIELSQINCFLTIIDQNSFSRAAEVLGLAQSAVSQKLRRLEDQLGIRLIERTSRQLRLSPQGVEFIPYARQMIEAEESARSAARRMIERSRNTLHLGGYGFLAEERLTLVEQFMMAVPDARVEVEHGVRQELLELLRAGRIDAFLCLAVAGEPMAEFHSVFVRRTGCHIAFPPGHPLAGRDSVRLEHLAGMQLAISPGREDAPVLNKLCEHLTMRGIILVPAPEADRRAITFFARMQGLPSLRWLENSPPRHEQNGDVILPIDDNPLFIEHYLYTRPGPQPFLVEKLREVAARFSLSDVPLKGVQYQAA
jgi:DNA-binding transcriptional LysR family regulator